MAVHPPYFTELRTAIEHIIYYQKYPTQKRTCSRSLTLLLWKCLKCYLLYWIIFCPIFLLLLIKYVYMHVQTLLLAFLIKLRISRRNFGTSRMGVISKEFAPEMKDVTQVSYLKIYDFICERVHLYIYQMTIGMTWHITDFLIGEQNFQIISDRHLQMVFLGTVMALNAFFDGNWIVFSFHGFARYKPYPGFYIHVRELRISTDLSKMQVKMWNQDRKRLDTVFWQENSLEKNSANWRLAKIHLQQAITIQSTGRSHTYVHFTWPNAMAVTIENMIRNKKFKKNSVLLGLLEPHLHHTESINYMALHVGNASRNTNTFWNRMTALWQPFPLSIDQFVGEIARRTHKYYNNEGMIKIPIADETKASHYAPPRFIQDSRYANIPYLYFLSRVSFPVLFVRQIF